MVALSTFSLETKPEIKIGRQSDKRCEALLSPPSADENLRRAKRSVYKGDDGRSFIEHWSIVGSPHAWAGGNPDGSYTDPEAPGASAAMLAFFLQHSR